MQKTYRNFILDQFQIDAIEAIERNHSVVVSAATGTGKTLIADYVINKAILEGKRVIYTAPIKALSNQKYREFKEAFPGKVGILTGDVVINPQGDILIMTTEIYRNMLLEQSPDIYNVSYVVFDEIHYINDIERGTVWEESIIFSPNTVRFLCLSATIPNFKQFAEWISSIKEHPVETVNYMKRAVPLIHECYDVRLGITTIDNVKKDVHEHNYPQYENRHKRQAKRQREQTPYHVDLIRDLEARDSLPCIFFSFSRALCEQRAGELSRKKNFTTPEQKKFIIEYYDKTITDAIRGMQSARDLKETLIKGVGVHHAGLLPKLKEIVENLFDRGMLKVLYATETFAVGINMPARTVCFGSLEKYDGITFRLLNSKEYFQLAGRAGRRGIDKVGYAISMIDRNKSEYFDKIKVLTSGDTDPITSRYNLSYNTVLNMIKKYKEDRIQTLLKSNFGYFIKKQSQNQVRIVQSFSNYTKILTKLGFLENNLLTWKGEFATRIYTKELEVSELVFSKLLEEMSLEHMNVVLASLIYEPRRMDNFDMHGVDVHSIMSVLAKNDYLFKKIKKTNVSRMYKIIVMWTKGSTFDDLLKICNLAEGDVIRLFRQLIDILRQIKGSLLASDPANPLIAKINKSLSIIDRDIICVEL